MLKGKNILLGISGGIAAYKIPLLIRDFVKNGATVKIVLTPAAHHFVTPLTLATLSKNEVFSQFFDATTGVWKNHVELGLWADVFIIAPATANTIAKMANGICDNLLLATYFSAKCTVIVAPAMDLDMFQHHTLKNNVDKLRSFGNLILPSPKGELASGLEGEGRMSEPTTIFNFVVDFFNTKKVLKKKKVLITAGSTVEKIDPVRFISNFSTGKMGIELAERAIALGAEVDLIIGPTHLVCHPSINRINIVSAQEMYEKVHEKVANANIIIMAAAVADFTPKNTVTSKIKKATEQENKLTNLELVPTKDILASVGAIKTKNQLLVGFALETDNEFENATNKLKKKKLDYIVLNSLNDKGAGFEHQTNKITMISKNGNTKKFELKSKKEVATDIFDCILKKVSSTSN